MSSSRDALVVGLRDGPVRAEPERHEDLRSVTKSVLLKAAQGVIENANEFEVRRLYILVRVNNRGTMILVR